MSVAGLARMTLHHILAFSVIFLLFLLAPPAARSCSCVDYDYWGPAEAVENHYVDDFPANGVLFGPGNWDAPTERDEALTLAAGMAAERPIGLVEGDVLGAGCTDGECNREVTLGAPDSLAPGRAELTDFRVSLPAIPDEGGAGCEFDEMRFRTLAIDDRTPSELIRTAVYIAPTLEELSTVEAPEVLLGSERAFRGEIRITLGWSGDRRRAGESLSQVGPFCFAVAGVDLAGNIGERSEALCVNTTDPEDPNVYSTSHDPACSGLFCAASPGTQDVPASMLLVCALGVWMRRRRGNKRPGA